MATFKITVGGIRDLKYTLTDGEITDGKLDTIYSALSNELEKCGTVGFGSDGARVIIGYKKVA